MKLKHGPWLILLIFLGIVGSRPTPSMGAPTNEIVVDSLAGARVENGDCSLREAIEAANTNTAVDNCAAGSLVSPDTITFNLNGTIFLNEPLIIGAGVTIQGNGQEETILDGQGITQVIQLNGNGRGHVELHDLTIQNGSAIDPIRGGGIYGDHHGHPLLLDGVTMRSNHGTLGGGIYIDENGEALTLIIRNSTFIDNVASGGSIPGIGGAVYWSSSCSSCDDHQFVIENSVFENNRAADGGGAVHADGSSLTVAYSTFAANEAVQGAAIRSDVAEFTLLNSTISDNVGNAINHSNYSGQSPPQLEFRNSTIVDNLPTNVVVLNEAVTVFSNTFIANHGAQNCHYSQGSVTSITLENNLADNGDCGFDETTDLIVIPATVQETLGALADNGGPTPTRALLPGSPAIDAGSCASDAADDQRGVARPQGDGCDIGAFEYEGSGMTYLPLVVR